MGKRIGLIGCGNMGWALIEGLLAARQSTPQEILASDNSAAQRDKLAQRFGIRTTEDNAGVAAFAQTLVLAVKPQVLKHVLREISVRVSPEHLLISVAAGVEIASIAADLPAGARIVRVMPNLPALVQAGATAIAAGPSCSASDLEVVQEIFAAVGRTVVVPESSMNAVTGLSGSGPAYVMLLIEGLADGGVRMGLPRETALLLAAQTVLGSAKLLLETGDHPGELKDRVTSPAGTTIAGVQALERAGLRHAMIQAVQAATERAIELGNNAKSAKS